MAKITDANSVSIKFKAQGKDGATLGTSNGKEIQANLPIDSFDFEKDQDRPPQHGIGNVDPIGLTEGNATYTLTMDINGDDVNFIRKMWAQDDYVGEVHIGMDETKYIVKGLGPTNLSYSGDDGSDPVQLSVDFNATNITTTDIS